MEEVKINILEFKRLCGFGVFMFGLGRISGIFLGRGYAYDIVRFLMEISSIMLIGISFNRYSKKLEISVMKYFI